MDYDKDDIETISTVIDGKQRLSGCCKDNRPMFRIALYISFYNFKVQMFFRLQAEWNRAECASVLLLDRGFLFESSSRRDEQCLAE